MSVCGCCFCSFQHLGSVQKLLPERHYVLFIKQQSNTATDKYVNWTQNPDHHRGDFVIELALVLFPKNLHHH